jgi:uncharacterized membrane protein
MKKTLFAAACAVAVATGCNQSPPGGNTTKPTTSSTDTTAATHRSTSNYPDTSGVTGDKGTFVIKAPVLATTIKQGDKQTVRLTVDRGSEFKQSVKLSADAPKGLKAEFNKSTVAAGDPEEVAMSVSVDKDAPLGDQTIRVTGTPDSGSATSVEVKVKVDEVKK